MKTDISVIYTFWVHSVKLQSSVTASAQAEQKLPQNNVLIIITTVQWYHFSPLQTSNFNLIISDWHKTKEWNNLQKLCHKTKPMILTCYFSSHFFGTHSCHLLLLLPINGLLFTKADGNHSDIQNYMKWRNSFIHTSTIYHMLSFICHCYSVVWSRNQCHVIQNLSTQGSCRDLCTSAQKQLAKCGQINNFML